MWWFFLCFLTSCMANSGLSTLATSEININNMSRLSLGMNETEVLHIMRAPHSKRTFQNKGNVYDIWFYITKPTVLAQSRLVPQNLTPLTFKNGILIGWGFDYYNYLIKQEELPEEAKPSPHLSLLSMCSRPRQQEPVPAEEEKTPSKDSDSLEEDEEMIEQENEQNFDYW